MFIPQKNLSRTNTTNPSIGSHKSSETITSILIPWTKTITGNMESSYTVYILQVQSDKFIWFLQKRFSQFEALNKELLEAFPKIDFPPMPEKRLFSTLDKDLVEGRRQTFQEYFQYFLQVKRSVFLHPSLQNFLKKPTRGTLIQIDEFLRWGEELSLDEITFDEEEELISKYLKEKPKNAVDGVAKGVVSFGRGLFTGVVGVVVDPITGAVSDGGKGFVQGLGRGLVGAVTRPMEGVFGFASHVSDGMSATATSIVPIRRAESVDSFNLNKKYFGAPLRTSMSRHGQQDHFLVQIMTYLTSNNGLVVPGIFRIAGNFQNIQLMQEFIESEQKIEYSQFGIHDITGLFKLFFRELPEPLLTWDLYPQFMALVPELSQGTVCIKPIRCLIVQLPFYNKIVADWLFKFLFVVASESEKNHMTPKNLGIIFGPSLLSSRGATPQQQLQDINFINQIIEFIIANYESIFVANTTYVPPSPLVQKVEK